jgi:hypothetical protein
MECPQQLSFSEVNCLYNEVQNISQIADFNEELDLNFTKKESLEDFLGMEDESTEISILLNSLDSGSITFNLDNRATKLDETESVSEILAILKRSPQTTRNKGTPLNDNIITPIGGGSIIRPVCVKQISLRGKVLSPDKPYPERVNNPVLKSSILTLKQ